MPARSDSASPDRRFFLRTLLLAGAVPFFPSPALSLDTPRRADKSPDHSPPTTPAASTNPARIRFSTMREAIWDALKTLDEHMVERGDTAKAVFMNADSRASHGHPPALHPDPTGFAIKFLSSMADGTSRGSSMSAGAWLSSAGQPAFFHPQMKPQDLAGRMLCAAVGLDERTSWPRLVSYIAFIRLSKAAGQLADVPIIIGETEQRPEA